MTADDDILDIVERHFVYDENGFVPNQRIKELVKQYDLKYKKTLTRAIEKLGGKSTSRWVKDDHKTKRGWKFVRDVTSVMQNVISNEKQYSK